MTTRLKMQMRCTIQRNGSATDSWGHPGAAGWANHLVDLACYAWVKTGREVLGDRIVVVSDINVKVPLNSDVTARDRIVSIKDRAGTVLYAGPMDIKSVERKPGYLEVMVISTL